MFHVLHTLMKYEVWKVTVLANGIENLIMFVFVSLLVIPKLAIVGRALSLMYV